jgi:hypothetical protein
VKTRRQNQTDPLPEIQAPARPQANGNPLPLWRRLNARLSRVILPGGAAFFWFEQIFLFDVEIQKRREHMSKQHPVFAEDKQKAPAQPKSDTLQQSPAKEGVGEGSKSKKTDDFPSARQLSPVRRMRQTSKSWSDADNELPKALAAAGASPIRAAAKFKRSIISVTTQARKLGVPFLPHRIAGKK